MTRRDVIILGAGLAGLSAARDLHRAGTDVLVLEARSRPGGRVEQTVTEDGRHVQLGGEIIGSFHTAYKDLVDELGLTLGPTFTANAGECSWALTDGLRTGEAPPWFSDAERRSYNDIEKRFAKLASTVDPDDPWSHPDAQALDSLSFGSWLRDNGASPSVIRALELAHLALAAESVERTSLLAELRKQSAAGATGFYDYEAWENERVLEGAATVADRMAEQLQGRIRYDSSVATVDVTRGRVTVGLASGEQFQADAVVCALPVGPLRDLRITGVSDQRLASLHRQRHAPANKLVAVYEDSFWENADRDGTAYMERNVLGGTWAQNRGILSALVPPECIGAYFATAPTRRSSEMLAEIAEVFGPDSLEPTSVFLRNWATDRWTQGYITGWRPGDVTAVGPLHGTHEPPFYVCGSDQWVCGYMEGAVRTGRGAAEAILSRS